MTERRHKEETDNRTLCRWCGSEIKGRFRYCATCHRNQGWLTGWIGPTSNWIAVIAAIITFLQLLASTKQANSSIDAMNQSDQALTQIRNERSRIEEIKGRVQQLEKSTQESSHATTQALLKIQAIDLQVQDLSVKRQREIKEKTDAADSSRETYLTLKRQLSEIPATIDVKTERSISGRRCIRVGFGKTCLPKLETITETLARPNPEYAELQMKVEQASLALQEAEAELSESLSR